MYCIEPANKKQKIDHNESLTQHTEEHNNIALNATEIEKDMTLSTNKSPILENKERSFKKCVKDLPILKRLSKFSRTVLDDNVVESKFFSTTEVINSVSEMNTSRTSIVIDESPEKTCRNPFKVKTVADINRVLNSPLEIDTECSELSNSQKENSPNNSHMKGKGSPNLESSSKINTLLGLHMENICDEGQSEESVIENTYPMEKLVTPVDSQVSMFFLM